MPTRSQEEPSRLLKKGSRTDSGIVESQLSDQQWEIIADLFPETPPRPRGGRPPYSNRECLEGILFVLLTGCRWKDLPRTFPSKSVCHQRFQKWSQLGVFQQAWLRLLMMKKQLGQINLETIIGDGTFIPAKKGGITLVPQNRERAPKGCC